MDPFDRSSSEMKYYEIDQKTGEFQHKGQKELKKTEKTSSQLDKIGKHSKSEEKILKTVTKKGTSIQLNQNPIISTNTEKVLGKKELSNLIEILNKSESLNEKKETIRRLTEVILERVPLIVEKMGQGDSDLAFDAFQKIVMGFGADPELQPFVQALGLVFSNMLAIQLMQEIKKCRESVNDGKEDITVEDNLREKHLNQAMETFFGKKLDQFETIAPLEFRKMGEKLLSIFPETGGTVNNTIKWLSEYSYGPLKIFPMAFGVSGANKAIELLDYIGVLLNKQKDVLSGLGEKGECELISKQEKKIENLKNEMNKRLFSQDIRFGSYGLKLFGELIDGALKLLPKKPEFEMFKIAIHGLKMGSSSLLMALPGTSVLSRMERISAFQKESVKLEQSCYDLQNEINQLKLQKFDQKELDAKTQLLLILQTKQEILQSRVIPMQGWLLIEDCASFGKLGKKFTVDFMSLMGIRGAFFGVLGGVGSGLTMAYGALWTARTLLTDRGLLRKWKGKFDLYLSNSALQKEISAFQLWVKHFADRVLPLENQKAFSIEQIMHLFAQENLKIEHKMGILKSQALDLTGRPLAKNLDHQKRLETAKKVLDEVVNAIFFESFDLLEIPSEELTPYKNKLLEAFRDFPEVRSLNEERRVLDERSIKIEESYKKERKYEQHFWTEDAYSKFSMELEEVLKDPYASNEFQKYLKENYKSQYDDIFEENENPNIERFMDFIFPDVAK